MSHFLRPANAAAFGPQGPCWVYSHIDADGDILYIGYTAYPEERDKQHSRKSPWYSQVVETQIEGPYTADVAVRREAALLAEIEPPFNIAGTSRARRVITAPLVAVERLDAALTGRSA